MDQIGPVKKYTRPLPLAVGDCLSKAYCLAIYKTYVMFSCLANNKIFNNHF